MRTTASLALGGLLIWAASALPAQAHDPDRSSDSVEFGFYAVCQMAGHEEGSAEWDVCVAAERARLDQRLAEMREDFLHTCREDEGHPPDSAALHDCLAREGMEKKHQLHQDIEAIRINPGLDRHPRLREAVADACAEAEGADGAREMCLFRETLSYRNRAEALLQILERDPALEGR